MSTNFHIETKDKDIHIGKRCAAGLYCYKCAKTLCEGGEAEIHTGKSNIMAHCSSCGERPVSTTCSFTWAIEPHKLAFMLYHNGDALIVDEYGATYSVAVFYDMLRDMCRIQFYTSIGKEFS